MSKSLLASGDNTVKAPKPLTFVSYLTPTIKHSGAAKRKRYETQRDDLAGSTPSKIRTACIACREKKTRCSGHQPCIRCQTNGHACQYMVTITSQPQTLSACDEPAIVGDKEARGRQTAKTDEPDDSLQEDQNGHIHGGSSEFAFVQLAKQRLASLPVRSIDFSDHPLPDSRRLPPILPSKDIADQLINTYFNFGLSTSRFVHEPSLRNIVNRLYNGEACEPDETALAYMVLALGSHYSKMNSTFCGYSASVRFYKMAHTQLGESPDLITLATTQTRLLLIHYLLNHARMHEAWCVFGIVVRHAQALGLHRRSRTLHRNHINHEYRNRLFWCIYINDRILSSMFGRPLAINDDDIDTEECLLSNDADIEESGCQITEDGVFCYSAALIHYARLARILGQILREFYTPSSITHSISRLYTSVLRFEQALADWQRDLPPYLDYLTLPPSAVSITAQRQMCTLKLMFAHASLLLYRPFILHSIDGSAEPMHDQWLRTCHGKSIQAANIVVSECRYLSQRGLFSRTFWLVTYMQFASVGTLLMYSYIWPEDTAVCHTAEEAMIQLSTGIDGDTVGQRYFEILKELRQITAGIRNNAHISQNRLDATVVPEATSIHANGADEGLWTHLYLDSFLTDDFLGQIAIT